MTIKCSICDVAYVAGVDSAFCPHQVIKRPYPTEEQHDGNARIGRIGSGPLVGWPQPPAPAPSTALETQVGGNHYTKLGRYQPWEVLKRWLTREEFRGYMKGEAIVYLAREQSKGGRQDIEKAMHVLQGYLELTKDEQEEKQPGQEEGKSEKQNLHKFTGIVSDGNCWVR